MRRLLRSAESDAFSSEWRIPKSPAQPRPRSYDTEIPLIAPPKRQKKNSNSTKWLIILSFIAGTVFAEIATDPTDFIFFMFFSNLSREQALVIWYFLSASFYLLVLLIAYFLYKIAPENRNAQKATVFAMIALTAAGAVMTWYTMVAQGADPYLVTAALAAPFTVALVILLRLLKRVSATVWLGTRKLRQV